MVSSRQKSRAARSSAGPSSVPSSRYLSRILPQRMKTRLMYGDNFLVAGGGAADLVINSFRANSCRDPVVAVGGGSCTGFTELSTLYTKYQVTSVTAEVWGHSTFAVASIYALIFRNSGTAACASGTDVQQTALEAVNPHSFQYVGPYNAAYAPTVHLKGSISIKNLEGVASLSDDDFSTTFVTEPVIQNYVDVAVCCVDGTSVNITGNFVIRITYDLVCMGPRVALDD